LASSRLVVEDPQNLRQDHMRSAKSATYL